MISFIFDHGIYFVVGALTGTVIGSAARHFLIKHGVISGEEIPTFTVFIKSEIEKDMGSSLAEDRKN